MKADSVLRGRGPLGGQALAAGQRDDGLTTELRAEREATGDQTQTFLQSTLAERLRREEGETQARLAQTLQALLCSGSY